MLHIHTYCTGGRTSPAVKHTIIANTQLTNLAKSNIIFTSLLSLLHRIATTATASGETGVALSQILKLKNEQ